MVDANDKLNILQDYLDCCCQDRKKVTLCIHLKRLSNIPVKSKPIKMKNTRISQSKAQTTQQPKHVNNKLHSKITCPGELPE